MTYGVWVILLSVSLWVFVTSTAWALVYQIEGEKVSTRHTIIIIASGLLMAGMIARGFFP